MFCRNCGADMPEGEAVCPVCGILSKEDVSHTPEMTEENFSKPDRPLPVISRQCQNCSAYQPKRTADPVRDSQATSTLVFGILGLAFADSFFLSFLGIIFSAIGLKKAKAYEHDYGILTGKSKVGRILSKVGLILGIVMTVLFALYVIMWIFYIALIIIMAAAGSGRGDFHIY